MKDSEVFICFLVHITLRKLFINLFLANENV